MKDFPLIILAAGKSSRMKIPKGLVQFKEKFLLQYQVDQFRSFGGKRVLLVLANHLERYKTEFPWESYPDNQIKIVVNEDPDRGQFSSVQLACLELLKEDAAWLLPIDCLAADKSTWQTLQKAFDKNIKVVVPEHQERGGHPILISKKFMQDLVKLDVVDKKSRLDFQIKELEQTFVARVNVKDPRICLNINCPDDLKQFL